MGHIRSNGLRLLKGNRGADLNTLTSFRCDSTLYDSATHNPLQQTMSGEQMSDAGTISPSVYPRVKVSIG